MKVTLKRQNENVHLKAFNEDGNAIDIDGAPKIGGENLGFRPMQLLLAGIGGCSTMDIVSILQKQRQDLKDLEIEVNAEREPNAVPSLFTDIHVHFKLYGNVDENKAKKAIDLSMEKYCSVTKILEKTAKVTYSFEII